MWFPWTGERLLVSQYLLIQNGVVIAMANTGQIITPPGAHVIIGRVSMADE